MLFWTSESALFNWDPLHRAFFCTSWVKSCLYGARKMGQRNCSFITPSESKETFYMGKMGSRLTKKPLTLKYVINHVHYNEQQNQVHAGFHKQSGVFHFLLISQKPTNQQETICLKNYSEMYGFTDPGVWMMTTSFPPSKLLIKFLYLSFYFAAVHWSYKVPQVGPLSRADSITIPNNSVPHFATCIFN